MSASKIQVKVKAKVYVRFAHRFSLALWSGGVLSGAPLSAGGLLNRATPHPYSTGRAG